MTTPHPQSLSPLRGEGSLHRGVTHLLNDLLNAPRPIELLAHIEGNIRFAEQLAFRRDRHGFDATATEINAEGESHLSATGFVGAVNLFMRSICEAVRFLQSEYRC